MASFFQLVLVPLLLTCAARLSNSQQGAPTLAVEVLKSYSINPERFPMVLLCVFSGSPAPRVTWSRSGQDLPTMSGSGGVYYRESDGALMVSRAGSGDNGDYECTGTNSQGQSTTATTRLTFVRPASFPWYISWYMWFVYAIILWGISIFFFIAWFFFLKRKAFNSLPAADGWIGN